MNKQLIFLFALSLLCACGSGTDTEENKFTTETEKWFPNFPAKVFLDIELGDELQKVANQLKQSAFSELENQDGHWQNENKTVEILLPDSEALSSLKVYFFDKNDSFFDDLQSKIQKNAQKTDFSTTEDEHSEYLFESNDLNYNLSLYKFDNQIRLHFKLNSIH